MPDYGIRCLDCGVGILFDINAVHGEIRIRNSRISTVQALISGLLLYVDNVIYISEADNKLKRLLRL